MTNDDLDRIMNDKTDKATAGFGKPAPLVVRVALWQNQLFVHRQSILKFLDTEIAAIQANRIPGINEYWGDSKVQYLGAMRKMFADLNWDDVVAPSTKVASDQEDDDEPCLD